MKIALVIDSNGGITKQQAHDLGYYFIPMPIIVDNVVYRDGEDIEYRHFLDLARATNQPMVTSQPMLHDILTTWDEALKEHDHIIHLPISSKLSKSYETCLAQSLQGEYLGKVTVIDTLDVIGTYLYTVQVAKKMIDDGCSLAEITEELEERRGSAIGIIVPETLTHLRRGGRINAATAAIANFLNFKPLIQLIDGGLEKLDKERGSKEAGIRKIIKKMLDHMMQVFDPTLHIPLILHTDEKAICDLIAEMWQPLIPDCKIVFCNISATVVCHTGPGAFAIARLLRYGDLEFAEIFN